MMSRRMASGESEEKAREASRKHNDNETNERKKRDTPRDSDRREAEKLKMNEEEVVEETVSNDEWYQNQLFESLTKKWAK